jgi:hypothetical protein
VGLSSDGDLTVGVHLWLRSWGTVIHNLMHRLWKKLY